MCSIERQRQYKLSSESAIVFAIWTKLKVQSMALRWRHLIKSIACGHICDPTAGVTTSEGWVLSFCTLQLQHWFIDCIFGIGFCTMRRDEPTCTFGLLMLPAWLVTLPWWNIKCPARYCLFNAFVTLYICVWCLEIVNFAAGERLCWNIFCRGSQQKTWSIILKV